LLAIVLYGKYAMTEVRFFAEKIIPPTGNTWIYGDTLHTGAALLNGGFHSLV